MAYTEVIQAVSGLSVGTSYQVRVIADATGFCRVYDPTLGGSVAADSNNLPTLTVTAQIQQESQNVLVDTTTAASSSGAATTNGVFKGTITPAAADLVNSSSVTAPVWLMPGKAVSGNGDAGGTYLVVAHD